MAVAKLCHHPAHVADAVGAQIRDRLVDGGGGFSRVQLPGEVMLEEGDLGLVRLRQLQ